MGLATEASGWCAAGPAGCSAAVRHQETPGPHGMEKTSGNEWHQDLGCSREVETSSLSAVRPLGGPLMQYHPFRRPTTRGAGLGGGDGRGSGGQAVRGARDEVPDAVGVWWGGVDAPLCRWLKTSLWGSMMTCRRPESVSPYRIAARWSTSRHGALAVGWRQRRVGVQSS